MSSVDIKVIEITASAMNLFQGYIDVTEFDRMDTDLKRDENTMTLTFYNGGVFAFAIDITDMFDRWNAALRLVA